MQAMVKDHALIENQAVAIGHAIVIGAGIGGLATAVALQRIGIAVTVYERSTELREVGAGLALWPNATRALESLDLGGPLIALAASGPPGVIRNAQGEQLAAPWPETMQHRDGSMMLVVHRADLQALLLDAVGRPAVRLGAECIGFSQDAGGVFAYFGDGTQVYGDLLIGADGLHSAVRAQLHGPSRPAYAGYTAWRGVTRFDQRRLLAGEFWGCGSRFGMMPISQGRVYWFGTANAREGERDGPAGRKYDVLQRFAGWHPSVVAVVEATEPSAILRNDIYDRPALPRWSMGRVTLLGDAAHPMTPNLAQGAGQALEDAVVLARCLAAGSEIAAALRTYERHRRHRTTIIAAGSHWLGWLGQWELGPACTLRDALVRRIPAQTQVRQLEWIVGHKV